MIRRLFTCTAIAGACLAGSVAAYAAPAPAVFSATDFVRIGPPADQGCIFNEAAKTATPEQKIENCTAGMAKFEALKAKAKSPAERTGISFLIASFDFVRAGSYLKLDGGRSARVCATVERAYAQVSGLDAALFDADLVDAFTSSRAAMSRSASACRKDYGVPAGAPALLPDQG